MNKEKSEADLNIFGDITSWEWDESDISSYKLSKQLEELGDVKKINVHINSYGGEVAEGLAIYNALKNHKAKVKTYCDGFACSIASVIFMAGDERIMSKSSLLMIHNAWSFVEGNANELRKLADDLDKMTSASINAYMEHVNIDEAELKSLLDNESWLTYDECLEMGFATSIIGNSKTEKASQSIKDKLIKMIVENKEKETEEDEKEKQVENDEETTEKDEDTEETENTDEKNPEEDKEKSEVTQKKAVTFFNVLSKL